jgi:type I restriction enzyme S subunit
MEKMSLPIGWKFCLLDTYMVKGGGSVDPSKCPNEQFDLYSIPAYDSQCPEILKGSEIGSTKKIVQENDVLLSRIVPHIQRSWVVGNRVGRRQIGSGEWMIFRGNDFVPKFMKYFLLSYEFHMKLMTTISGVGGSLTRANPTLTGQFEIPLPPIAEQKNIVAKIEELLSDLENGKQQLQTAQKQLKIYRQSLLNRIVTGINCKSIESVIDKLDQGWSPKCLNEHSSDVNQWAVIKTTAIQQGFFLEDENKILPVDLVPREQHELKSGDILITRAGPRIRVGVCCMIKTTRSRLINCDKVYRIKVNHSVIKPEYFELILNTPYYQREIEKMKSGISDSGLNLTQSKFLKIEIPIPSLEEQKTIVADLEAKLTLCDNITATIGQSLAQTETLRQSILKKAFEGKLVPNNNTVESVIAGEVQTAKTRQIKKG